MPVREYWIEALESNFRSPHQGATRKVPELLEVKDGVVLCLSERNDAPPFVFI